MNGFIGMTIVGDKQNYPYLVVSVWLKFVRHTSLANNTTWYSVDIYACFWIDAEGPSSKVAATPRPEDPIPRDPVVTVHLPIGYAAIDLPLSSWLCSSYLPFQPLRTDPAALASLNLERKGHYWRVSRKRQKH